MLTFSSSATKISPPKDRYNEIHPGSGNLHRPPELFCSSELMRHQGLGWVAALSLSLPQEQQHPSQTLRAKRNSPFLQEQSPLSPLQYIPSLIHPEPQSSHAFLSKYNLLRWQSVFPALPYTFSSATDRIVVSQLFGAVFLWLPSLPLPSPAAPTPLLPSPSPAKSPTGDKHQPNRFSLSLRSRNFLYWKN